MDLRREQLMPEFRGNFVWDHARETRVTRKQARSRPSAVAID